MFLKLAHTKLDVFKCSRELALSCYRLTKQFPDVEKFGMVQQRKKVFGNFHEISDQSRYGTGYYY